MVEVGMIVEVMWMSVNMSDEVGNVLMDSGWMFSLHRHKNADEMEVVNDAGWSPRNHSNEE